MTSVDPISLRRVLGHFATGVAVVGTRHLEGGVCGLTANAFTSVSLSPPLVLVCVDRTSNSYPCLRQNGFFTASFLASDQHPVSVRFAEKREDKFEGIPYRPGTGGAPIVEGAVGFVECTVQAEYAGGDHGIFVAHVTNAGSADGLPLVFFRGGYTTVVGPGKGEEPALLDEGLG
jgi:3-hydroxy-9,10-secoandrosta-1,3,5(10)-triene-9,17-dione monooxygenase reductase component